MMTLEMRKFSSIDDVPCHLWDSIAPRGQVCLESDHLKAIEWSGINAIRPTYLIAAENGIAKGIAHFFRMKMDFSGFGENIKPAIRKSMKCWYPNFLEMSMLECGLISGIGQTIAVDDRDASSFIPLVIREMEEISRNSKADIILVRDIPYEKFSFYYQFFKEYQYEPILGFPIAMMRVPGNTFEEYLRAYKSKSRDKIIARLKKQRVPEIKVEVISDFGAYSDRLFQLSEQTSQRADEYEHEKLTSEYFYKMNECLAEKCFIIAAKLNEEIVSFFLCLEGENELCALHCGIDYRYNEQYQLYFNLYFNTIAEALRRGKHLINFGITTYDYKLMIGCELQPVVYFVKHIGNPEYTLALAKMFKDSIKPVANYHRPFKNQDISSRIQMKEIEQEIEEATDKAHGVLNKANRYTRMDTLRLAKLYSFCPPFESAQKEYVNYQGKRVIMLGSNSYLGLGSHPRVCQAAKAAIDKYGTGCSGSPCLNGTLDIHADLARALADFMQKEDALIFSTGYQTNLGVVAAIAGRHELLILDSLNHASIMDGAKFSYADVVRFEHDDMESLENILKQYPNKNKFIVVDSVFSMEGTMANLPEIVRLAKKYNAKTMVDEAHGIGVLGPGGRGAVEHFGLLDQVDIVMGTFSKSFAGVGGFVASTANVIDYLRHVARSHLFSASLPPAIVGAVRASLDIIINEPERRIKLLDNAKFMADSLRDLGYDAKFNGTAIVPIYCCEELLTLGLFNKLFAEGVYVNPVVSPAVPKGKELLRTSYMAIHDRKILSDALRIFDKVRTPYFPVNRLSVLEQARGSETRITEPEPIQRAM